MMPHGEKSSFFFSCLQHFTGKEAGLILLEENTNKLNEPITIAINNKADFFISINC